MRAAARRLLAAQRSARPPDRSRSAAWRGSSGHSTPGTPRQILGQRPLPVCRAIVEPLANRELEVLEMLAAGKSNQAIAGQFVVTLDTVKSTSAMCWASSARPTAPRPSAGPGSWA
jgi:ATP/maltotriose-dependent transcriptional regulator MalT